MKNRVLFIVSVILVIAYIVGIQRPLSRAITQETLLTAKKEILNTTTLPPLLTQASLWPLLNGLTLQKLQLGPTKHKQRWLITPITCEVHGSFDQLARFINQLPFPIEHLHLTAQETDMIATVTINQMTTSSDAVKIS